jgi:hypothetical protein
MERDDPIAGLRQALATSRPDADFGLLRRAHEVAQGFHQGQLRESGDPYISHPVMVATLLAMFGADDQTLCAAILHDTVEYSNATITALQRKFGREVATMVSEAMVLKHLGRRQDLKVADMLAMIRSADRRVVKLKLADRLHNMRTIEFLQPPKQLFKARETLDIFAPTAEGLCLPAVGAELQNLAFGTLIQSQPALQPIRRIIMALDIERSTSRIDPVKGELRIMLYELFDAALRSANICPDDRDPFEDRGDGLLALIHARGQIPLRRVVTTLAHLLARYNAGNQRELRVRMVVHEGEVNYDGHGCFGTALDTAFRLLDAPAAKKVLASAPGPMLLIMSEPALDGLTLGSGRGEVSVDVGGRRRSGRVFLPL